MSQSHQCTQLLLSCYQPKVPHRKQSVGHQPQNNCPGREVYMSKTFNPEQGTCCISHPAKHSTNDDRISTAATLSPTPLTLRRTLRVNLMGHSHPFAHWFIPSYPIPVLVWVCFLYFLCILCLKCISLLSLFWFFEKYILGVKLRLTLTEADMGKRNKSATSITQFYDGHAKVI